MAFVATTLQTNLSLLRLKDVALHLNYYILQAILRDREGVNKQKKTLILTKLEPSPHLIFGPKYIKYN